MLSLSRLAMEEKFVQTSHERIAKLHRLLHRKKKMKERVDFLNYVGAPQSFYAVARTPPANCGSVAWSEARPHLSRDRKMQPTEPGFLSID
jgi:hypothetical protein